MPRRVAVDMVHVLIGTDVEDRLARGSGCFPRSIEEAAKRAPGPSEWSAAHGRRIIRMPSGVCKEMVYMLIDAYIENCLPWRSSGCHAGGIKKAGNGTA